MVPALLHCSLVINTYFKVIDEIQAELLLLRKQQEDRDNHNHIILGDSALLELTKDISCPTEDCFPAGASGK